MNREDFELGRDVTVQAKAEGKRDTVVLSVRVSSEDLRRLKILAQGTGMSVSQIAREALSAYTPSASGPQSTSYLTFVFPTETMARMGEPSQATGVLVPSRSR